jgi:hypothetical protein
VAGTFLLGVGAMKAGTTWLHDHLAGSPQCEPGLRKEYHVFDSLDLGQAPYLLPRVVEKARASLDVVASGTPTDATFLQQAAMIADERLYVDYFAGLLTRPGIRMTLDITPGYARLSSARLSAVRAAFEERSVRAVSLFLMRDPVQRIWSQVRMQKRRRPAQNPGTAEALVAQRYAEPSYAERTRYEVTLANLDASFGAASAYGFYEELFDPATSSQVLRGLSEAAGIEHREPDLDQRFNVSPASAELPEAVVREVARHFAATYEAVGQRFPDRDLERIWPSARFAR